MKTSTKDLYVVVVLRYMKTHLSPSLKSLQPGPGFTKGLKQKIVITLREKNFVIKLRLFLLRQNGMHKRS